MMFHIHQTHHTIADFQAIGNTLKSTIESNQTGVHVFPELFLCGYPLHDLCLQKSFIETYQKFLNELDQWAQKQKKSDQILLVGGIKYDLTEDGLPLKLSNVIYKVEAGSPISAIYTKQLLPNYDIFDEMKYFTAGSTPGVLEYKGKQIGLLICEDMWSSSFHQKDPVLDLKHLCDKDEIKLDMLVNLSASPFVIEKNEKRLNRAKFISNLFEAPYLYVNRVGAEDEILFDGRSFVVSGDKLECELARFRPDSATFNLKEQSGTYSPDIKAAQANTWEELFAARISPKAPSLSQFSPEQCEEVLEALCFGFQDYARKNGFNRFTIALSGGMDSALVLTIIKLSLKEGQYLEAIYMPSVHSSTLSYDLSLDLCENLGIPFKSLPIKFLHSTSKNLFTQTFQDSFEGLTDENIQSRLRGMLLYTRSNQIGSMVVNTSNKSELAVGYSTQYGDSVGAISMLGDLYKSEVFHLANYINETRNNIIPERIITRPPSAELRPDQVDTESLPPYERLDAILEGLLTYRHSMDDLISFGFKEEEVQRVFNLYRKSEYKRYQFCPIIKISSKSFGFGYRIPLSKDSNFYINK
ncbi:MAG: NAD+ synthase [Bacteriovoracaceae bacterium]|nr:NAD+ synthase [Bacteriovoracaceae bacterium]